MSEIKMLPLPKKAQLVNLYAGRGIPTYGHSDETLTDYARAVAGHNVRFLTHELANAECAIDAEQAGRKKAEAEIEALKSDLGDYMDAANYQAARAERLAEALRLIAAPKRQDGTWNRDREACRQIAENALRDHDQEGKDG